MLVVNGQVTDPTAPVNRAPVAADDSDYVFQITVDPDAQGNVITLAPGVDVDPDGDSLVVVGFAAGDQSGQLSGHLGEVVEGTYGLITMQADGSWNYALKPTAPELPTGVVGHDLFSYTVSDGHGGFDTAHLDILVHAPPFPGARWKAFRVTWASAPAWCAGLPAWRRRTGWPR